MVLRSFDPPISRGGSADSYRRRAVGQGIDSADLRDVIAFRNEGEEATKRGI